MYMIAIALLGAMLLSWSLASTEPDREAHFRNLKAETLAANFWAYRDALASYRHANPMTAGTQVAVNLISDYLPPGYRPLPVAASDPEWSHYFDDDRVLYTFTKTTTPCATPPSSTPCMPAGLIDAIANHHDRSVMIGIAQTGTTMTSIFTLTDTIVLNGTEKYPVTSGYTQDPTTTWKVTYPLLPAAANIPPGALVVVGG